MERQTNKKHTLFDMKKPWYNNQKKAEDDVQLKSGEKVEDLQNGYMIIQSPRYFAFGTDAVLLADFADVAPGQRVVDFGTGCGIIPILLCAKQPDIHVTGIEIQIEIADMAQRSVLINNMEKRVNIISGDLKDARKFVPHGVNVVVCNPPYEKADGGKDNNNVHVSIAKRELKCTLEDVVGAAAKLLRTGGRMFMIYRTERFAELMDCMRAKKIEPKRIRMVAPQIDKAPNFVLVEGRAGAHSGVKFAPTLAVYEKDGSYTQELKKIYRIGEETPCSIS